MDGSLNEGTPPTLSQVVATIPYTDPKTDWIPTAVGVKRYLVDQPSQERRGAFKNTQRFFQKTRRSVRQVSIAVGYA